MIYIIFNCPLFTLIQPQSTKLFKRILKIIVLAFIYQLAKFGDFMMCGLKDIFKNASYLMYVTDLVNHGMVKSTKTGISSEWNIIFLQKKKILNLCFRWHILRSYHFVAEVTFKHRWVFRFFKKLFDWYERYI